MKALPRVEKEIGTLQKKFAALDKKIDGLGAKLDGFGGMLMTQMYQTCLCVVYIAVSVHW
jgi:hypothetical protein